MEGGKTVYAKTTNTHATRLFEGNEPRRVGGTDTRSAVLDGLAVRVKNRTSVTCFSCPKLPDPQNDKPCACRMHLKFRDRPAKSKNQTPEIEPPLVKVEKGETYYEIENSPR